MAAKPNKAIAGCDPFADLLFSPRAVLIWDHATGTITWMNGAARSKFGLGGGDLQAKLAARLGQCFDAANGNGKTAGSFKFKAGRLPAISCTFEVLELAGGHKGLIVSEAASPQEPANVVHLPKLPQKKTAKSPGKPPAQAKQRQLNVKPAAPVCQLTAEEMRAFKTIGRTVRRLAREKQRSTDTAPRSLASPKPVSAPPLLQDARPDEQATPAQLFSAFDLVLFLDEDFVISRTDGRPQHIGWRKSGLLGQPALKFLAAPEHTVFRRMTKKLGTGAKICRDTLVLLAEAGGNVPCRAILGRWHDGDTRYFLALLSLDLPSRLKRLATVPQITRLAA